MPCVRAFCTLDSLFKNREHSNRQTLSLSQYLNRAGRENVERQRCDWQRICILAFCQGILRKRQDAKRILWNSTKNQAGRIGKDAFKRFADPRKTCYRQGENVWWLCRKSILTVDDKQRRLVAFDREFGIRFVWKRNSQYLSSLLEYHFGQAP